MTENSRTLAVVLLVVGLAVGAGAGYLLSNNSLQPRITELDEQVTVLSSNLNLLSSGNEELESQVEAAQNEYDQLVNQKADAQAALDNVNVDLEEKQALFSTLANEKNALDSKLTPPLGHFKFMMFGLSFDYPEDWELELRDVNGEAADSSWSEVIATYNDGEKDFGVTWIAMPYYPEILDVYWNGSLPVLEELYGATVISINYTTVSGYTAKMISFSGTVEGHFQYSRVAAFYSDATNKIYVVQYNVSEIEDLDEYIRYYESVRVGV